MTIDMQALDWSQRRLQKMRDSRPKCPSCGEAQQIQLIYYLGPPPAGWKCRTCKHKFDWEPM